MFLSGVSVIALLRKTAVLYQSISLVYTRYNPKRSIYMTKKITGVLLFVSAVSLFGQETLSIIQGDFEIVGTVLVKYHGDGEDMIISREITVIGEDAFGYANVSDPRSNPELEFLNRSKRLFLFVFRDYS
jgi:hypothetical protein